MEETTEFKGVDEYCEGCPQQELCWFESNVRALRMSLKQERRDTRADRAKIARLTNQNEEGRVARVELRVELKRAKKVALAEGALRVDAARKLELAKLRLNQAEKLMNDLAAKCFGPETEDEKFGWEPITKK